MSSVSMRAIKSVLMSLVAFVLLAAFVFLAGNAWVLASTARYIDSRLEQCRASDVAVVFGTSHWTRSGLRNPHFNARMRTSAGLIDSFRVNHLLLSGDNRTQAYNEPRAMWRDLHRRGVPSTQMTLDFAGFSTYDTLVRARDVFQLNEALLVTQSWHLPRAIYIGRSLGMDVAGCVAEQHRAAGEWRLRLREWVARVATLGDLYVWGREPYFLGPVEPIELFPEESAPQTPTPLRYYVPIDDVSADDVSIDEVADEEIGVENSGVENAGVEDSGGEHAGVAESGGEKVGVEELTVDETPTKGAATEQEAQVGPSFSPERTEREAEKEAGAHVSLKEANDR